MNKMINNTIVCGNLWHSVWDSVLGFCTGNYQRNEQQTELTMVNKPLE